MQRPRVFVLSFASAAILILSVAVGAQDEDLKKPVPQPGASGQGLPSQGLGSAARVRAELEKAGVPLRAETSYAPVTGDDSVIEDIANEGVQKLMGYFTGETAPPPELPIVDTYIDNFNIPQCAMQVSRDEDLGAISSYQPDEPCGCYFEARATGRTSCEECEESTDCPDSDPVCRFGYCEVQ